MVPKHHSPNRERETRRDRERQRARTLPDLDTQRVREHHWMRLKMKQGASSNREKDSRVGERQRGDSRETAGRQQSKTKGRERGKGLIILLLFHLLYIDEQ